MGEKSLHAPAKKGSLEGASTCNMELGEHGVLEKKVKFSTTIWRLLFLHMMFAPMCGR